MEAKELRIGNLLRNPFDKKTVVEVSWMTLKNFTFHGTGDAYDPIPLDKTWLKEFGFKQHAHYKHLFFLNQFRIDTRLMSCRILRPCNSEGESSQRACGFPFLTDDIKIHYVHQLQNLYFALTSHELETK